MPWPRLQQQDTIRDRLNAKDQWVHFWSQRKYTSLPPFPTTFHIPSDACCCPKPKYLWLKNVGPVGTGKVGQILREGIDKNQERTMNYRIGI